MIGLVSTALLTLVIASCESDAPEAGVSLSGAAEADVRQAIESDDLEIFRSLIADSELQRSPQLDGNPLLIAATIGRARAIVEHMLQQGVDPDQRDQRGTRALFLAIRREDVGTVRLLLDAGADPDEPSPEPRGPSLGTSLTPLHAAVHLGNLEIVSLLIAAGADVNAKLARIGSPLETAIMTTDADALEMLVDAGATIASGVVIKDPLVGVIQTSRRAQDTSDHERMLRVLVGIGADPDGIPERRPESTPLGRAISLGKLRLVETLLELGADPTLPVEEHANATRAAESRAQSQAGNNRQAIVDLLRAATSDAGS